MNWQNVSLDEVCEIHRQVTKGGAELLDFGLLHSAVERPNASYKHQDLYPTIFTKAAALLQSLTLNHPFTDGNKRTAWLSTKRFLYLNGYHLKANKVEAVGFVLRIDTKKLPLAQITSWLKKNSTLMK